ncbi:MAG: cation:proton antiporter [Candidatus Micrarchaeota archaeon]
MAITVESSFLILGGILFIGYLGEIVAKKFSIPSALLLLIIGYLLRVSGQVEPSGLLGIQELFSALALIVLLFDGGLSLDIYEVVFKSQRVMVMAMVTMALGILCSAALSIILGIDLLLGAIIGAIAGGIGSTTTISMVRNLSIPSSIKNFLTLESSITDVLSIILTIVLTQAIISGAIDVQIIGQGILSKFSVGVFLGLIVGILSLITLAKLEKGYKYMMTFAIVLVLFGVTEMMSGSGAIAVLVLGIVFGNEHSISKIFRLKNAGKTIRLKEFQTEVSFFVRTFFFVFLGIIVTIGSLENFMIGLGLTVMFYFIRSLSVRISTFNSPLAEFRKILTAIGPRGLATAVLATYPILMIQSAIAEDPGNQNLMKLLSQVAGISEISFYIILLSIIGTTIAVPIVANGNGKEKEDTEDKKEEQKKEKDKKED